MLAAEQGSLEILQELIRRGANVNLDDVVSHSVWEQIKAPASSAPFTSFCGDHGR